jgi:hypothetical protein
VREAVDIARGDLALVARSPADPSAVSAAEQVLGIGPGARPLYAYLGDLHPELGTVGLIVERSWLRSLTGVTRCDSGGLGGRRGGFATLSPAEAASALSALSFSPTSLPSWPDEFAREVDTSYALGRVGYVDGELPDVRAWQDPRATCIARATPPPDRRLWTWEVRLDTGPAVGDVVALALSEGAAMVLDDLHRRGLDVPDRVRIFRGSTSIDGARFQDTAVRSVLAGES